MELPEFIQDAIINCQLCKKTYESQDLIQSFPPKLRHSNKKIVYQKACPEGSAHKSDIVFSRWREVPLPTEFDKEKHNNTNVMREDVFSYKTENSDSIEWHLNFAHSQLFVAYYGPLFAQDEMQVAEHPVLASLREALIELQEGSAKPITRENFKPTPILIRGAERRCYVKIDVNAEEGRPHGLYGNFFAKADATAIERATIIIDPPTITNLIAMEAPPGGTSTYTLEQIQDILSTAFSSFRVAQIESLITTNLDAGALIHTGNWGTGAYGGDRVLMVMLQLLAAKLAQIDTLIFHTFDKDGSEAYKEALDLLENKLLLKDKPVQEIINEIFAMKFKWGVSDGN